MNMIDLTPGQQRLRAIFASEFEQYRVLASGSRELSLLFLDLRARMAVDQVITEDPITGHILGYSRVAYSYMDWIKQNTREEKGARRASFRLDQFIYDHGGVDRQRIPAYCGGEGSCEIWDERAEAPHSSRVAQFLQYLDDLKLPPEPARNPPKWATTYWALFELARTGRTPQALERLPLIYYEPMGILMAGSGGNHRTLAHVLWGQDQIAYDRLTVYICDVPFDALLNQALLRLETALLGPWIPGDAQQRWAWLEFRLEAHTVDERERVHAFVETTTDEELATLRKYAGTRRMGLTRTMPLTITWLVEHRDELRRLQGRQPQRRWYAPLAERFGRTSTIPSAFELWYRELHE